MTPATMLVRPSRQYRQRGFTILELLVAFAIMAISLGMLYRASGGSARSVGDMERYQRATVLAESIMAMRDAVPEEDQAIERGEYDAGVLKVGHDDRGSTRVGPRHA